MTHTDDEEDPRDNIRALKRSRGAYKGRVTRTKELTEDLVQAYDGEDPTKLELTIQGWKEALRKFVDADNLVMADRKAERADADKDIAAAEVSFYNAQAEIIGFRREFDAPRNNDAAPQQAHIPPRPLLDLEVVTIKTEGCVFTLGP